MNALDLNSPLIQIGVPALVLGLLLGALIAWLIAGRRQARLEAVLSN